MKICVYTIALNEGQFVDRWYESMKEADYVCVLDTGSDDDTVKKLKARGVIVKTKKIKPWRFDVARNESMKLIPDDTDLCVCTDLDEVLQPGWRKKVEDAWEPGVNIIKYKYIWNFDSHGKPGKVFYYSKFHSYGTHKWVHAVHEVLVPVVPIDEKTVLVDDIVLEHHADRNKSRGNYLPLLKIDVGERPDDDRARHYYARELMYYGHYQQAIEQFKVHLSLPSATWREERCSSMRYIARCSPDAGEKEAWLCRAIAEAPHTREPLKEMAKLQYDAGNWHGVVYFAEKALSIKKRALSYVTEPSCWDHTLYDMLSIAYWKLNDTAKSRENIEKAFTLAPDNERIRINFETYCKG